MKTAKYIFIAFLLLQITIKAQTNPPVSNPDCPNGDAENGNLTNWVTYKGISTNPQNMSLFTPLYLPLQIGVHAATGLTSNFSTSAGPMLVGGIDYYGGFAIPNQGTHCIRVGNSSLNNYSSQGDADMIRYQFTVTNANKHFKFRYATVLQSGHDPSQGENPSVIMYMTLGSRIYPNFGGRAWWSSIREFDLYAKTFRAAVADVNNPYFKLSPRGNNVVYKDWQCVEYDLSQYVGQVLSFNFMARDCVPGVHFGYAYLDGLCTDWPAVASMTLNKSTFCDDGTPVIMNGVASTGEDRYFVEVAECDAGGTFIPGGDIVNQWYLGAQVPSSFNITSFFNNAGKNFKCGKYYKIKLAVMNDCALWNQTSQIIQFQCPKINAGINQILCCGVQNPATISLGNEPIDEEGYTYNWASFPQGFVSSLPVITVPAPTRSTAYMLTVTDANGCKVTDSVIIRFQNPAMTLNINKLYYDGYKVCDLNKYLSADVTNPDCLGDDPYFVLNYPVANSSKVQWKFQDGVSGGFSAFATGQFYTPPNANGLAIANINNGCASLTKNENVKLKKYGESIIAPISFSPNSDGLNDDLVIQEYGLSANILGDGPAYNASDFRLTIFTRDGPSFRTITKLDVGRAADEPLKNGDIKWDGKDASGSVVAFGTYEFLLELKYCGQQGYTYVCPEGQSPRSRFCSERGPLGFCTKRITACVGLVTVLR